MRFFRHALALDERRAAFWVNPWHRRRKDRDDLHDGERHKTDVREVWFAGCHAGFAFPLFLLPQHPNILCVYYADVGGGSVPNSTENSLARVSLRWMILECFRTGSGIRFRREALKGIGINQNTLTSLSEGRFTVERARLQRFATEDTVVPTSPPYASPTEKENAWLLQDSIKDAASSEKRTPDFKSNASDLPTINEMSASTGASAFETEQELKDALSPIYDQLKICKIWWLPEVIPLRHRVHGLEDLKSLRGHHWSYVSSHCRFM